MSTITCTISGNPVSLKNGAFEFGDALEARAQLKFTVEDSAGTSSYTRGQPVVLFDSVSGVLFRGFVSSSQPIKLGLVSAAIEHEITCIDKQYLIDKRANTTNYQGWYAGDIVADMIERTLSDEGVTGIYAIDHDSTQAEFATGTLTNTVATANLDDGCLELAKAGSDVSFVEATTSDFSSGTLTNVTASNNTLSPTTTSAIFVEARLLVSLGATNSLYLKFWGGTKTVGTNDTLLYDIWISSESPAANAGIDLHFSDGTRLRTQTTPLDQNNLSPSPATDLGGYATDTWYSRTISLGSANNGKNITSVTIGIEGESEGTYKVYVKNIRLGSAPGSPFFSTSATTTNVNPPTVFESYGYIGTLASATVVSVFDPLSSSRISTAHSIDAAKLVRASSINWQETTPGDSSVSLYITYDGTSYLQCTNGSPLPALPAGSNVAGVSVTLQERFAAGSDPTKVPILTGVQVSVQSAINATKSDITANYGNATAWNTGTYAGLTTDANGDLTLGTLTRNWSDGLITTQTFFPQSGSGVTESVASGAYQISVPGQAAPHKYGLSRLDFAGSLQDFTIECDLKATTAIDVGIVYRTSGWATFDLNFGYLMSFQQSVDVIHLGFGSNSNDATSIGTYTEIASASHTFASGTTYHFKIVVNGNRHRCFIDGSGTAAIDFTHTTNQITGAGNFGFRVLGNTSSSSGTLDNFEVTPATLGTWQSPSTSLNSLGTIAGSVIAWHSHLSSGETDETAIVQASIDAGATWKTCENNATIPGLSSGTSVIGVSLLTKVILYGQEAVLRPAVWGLSWRVLGAYPQVSGTRTTIPLGNDTMVRSDVVGSFGTSFDSQTYTKTGTGTTNLTSNKAIISNTTGDVHMKLGSKSATDTDGDVRFSISASAMQAGIELRYTDSSNFYRFATSGTSAYIQKVSGGSGTVLQSTSVSLTTSTLYRMRFRVSGSSTTSLSGRIWLDGTLEPSTWTLQASDASSPLLSGGLTLFGSGTGTASFDQFRVTQYPDPSLSLAPVLPRLGSSSVSWNAVVPSSTTFAMRTSLDGVNWSSATSGTSITGLTGQASPTIDSFSSNTSANYTSTNKSGGSVAAWTYDTANSRITASGGSSGLYIYNAITDDDVDVLCDMDRSDAGGLVWRYVDASNYYELGAYDDSATGGFTNQLRLYKVAGGTRSLLGTASTISWPRATAGTSPYKRIRVTMLGAVVNVYFDGTFMQTHTDGSPLGVGKVGLRNDGGESRYYQLRIQPQGDYVSGTPEGDAQTGKYVYTEATLTTTNPAQTPQLKDLTVSARGPKLASGALIEQLHDPDKPFTEFFNKELDSLVEASGDYFWSVDKDGVLSFQQREATPAPWILHSSDLLFEPNVTPVSSADLYRDRQTITNCIDITTTQTEQKIADGSASSWTMAYPLYSAPTVTAQDVSKTVGIKGIDTGKDFYWAKGDSSIGQDEDAAKLPEGSIIEFSYVGQFETQVTRNNSSEQTARAAVEIGTTGIVEAIEDGKGMLASAAETYADGLLARYGRNDAVQLEAATHRSGLAPGQILPVFISEHGLFDRQLLITKVDTEAEQKVDGNVLYTYKITATDGANLTDWTSVFFG